MVNFAKCQASGLILKNTIYSITTKFVHLFNAGKWKNNNHMSHVLRKSAFFIFETKDADQLRSDCTADQHLCFLLHR